MKKAIIVGATSGIGRGLARLLIENNYKVGINGRRSHLLNDLKNENPNHYCIRAFDIKPPENTAQELEELVLELGGLDLLVICSGVGDFNKSLDFNLEKHTIDTNITGFTSVADWSFNFFQHQKAGHLVAISSIAGLRGSNYAPACNATKAYQINYLEGLRKKAKKLKFPIFVTDIRPGLVDTDMAKGDGLFWISPVDKAAKPILHFIKKRKEIAYVTKRWELIAVLLKLMPRPLYDKL